MSEPTDELTPAIYAIQRACDEVLNVDDPDKVADILDRIQRYLNSAKDAIEPCPPTEVN